MSPHDRETEPRLGSAPPIAPAPARKRLSSIDLEGELSSSAMGRLAKELLERIEGLEGEAAKASDVREVADQFKAYREQLDERNALRDRIDNQILAELAASRAAAGASAVNSRWARVWAKVVAMGTVAGPALVLAFAYWGVAHPGAFGGLAGAIGLAILGVARGTTPPTPPTPGAAAPPTIGPPS